MEETKPSKYLASDWAYLRFGPNPLYCHTMDGRGDFD